LLLPKLDFDNVFAESSPFVWRVLGRLGVARSDVADVCQEVFVIVHRRLADYDGRVPVQAWIYGICLRQAAEYRRRRRRRRELVGETPPQIAAASQDRELELRLARGRLHAVLETLEATKREVFVLYELEELPMSEVARILDCPLQTAYSRLHSARKVVLSAFEELERTSKAG
jgi:RNA polymerase sigma-70 factor (ECF subfamily)